LSFEWIEKFSKTAESQITKQWGSIK
jgi:hypothetical protein